MALELPYGIRRTTPGMVDEYAGPYPDLATAQSSVPDFLKPSVTFRVGSMEYWWSGGILQSNITTKVDQAYTAAEKSLVATHTTQIAQNTIAIASAATSGVIGVIPSLSFNPPTPSSNVAYEAQLAGTYTNFLDSTNTPITVSSNDGNVHFRFDTSNSRWTKVKSLIDLTNYTQKSVSDQNLLAIKQSQAGVQTGYVEYASVITNGSYISSTTGDTVVSTDYQYSNYIAVTPGQVIYYTGTLGGTAASIAGYSAPDVTSFVQLVFNLVTDGQGTTRRAYDEKAITIPAGVNYIRASSAFQNPGNSGYVGGMRKLSVTNKPKSLSVLNSIDTNVEELTKLYGVATNVINLSLPVFGQKYDSATNSFAADATRGNTGYQPVVGNRNYTFGPISGFLIMYDANLNPIGYYQTAAIAFLDNAAIPKLSTGFSYNATTLVLTFRTPWNCAFVVANNSGTLANQAAYDAWKASLNLNTDVKGTTIKTTLVPQVISDAIATNTSDILSLIGSPSNVINLSLPVYGQRYDSATNSFVTDAVRAHTGYQPVTGSKQYTMTRISNFLILYNSALTPIGYYSPTAVSFLDGLSIPRLTTGFTYDSVNFSLTFTTPISAAYVVANNNTQTSLTTSTIYDAWKTALTLTTDTRGTQLKASVIPTSITDSTTKIDNIFKEKSDVTVRSLFQNGVIYQTATKTFQATANRATTGLQPVLPSQDYTLKGITKFLVIFNSAMAIIGYYALSSDSTTIANMAGYTRYNIVVDSNYDSSTGTLTFNTQAGGAFIAANNFGTLADVAAYNAWYDSVSLQTKVTKPYISKSFLPVDIGSASAFTPITQFPAMLAHRGLHAASTSNVGGLIAPEDSLDAVKMAHRLGYEIVETDVQVTSDGVFVICHDDTINRTYTNLDGSTIVGTVTISANTFANLRANYKLRSNFPRFQQPIPSLTEYCNLCSKLRLKAFIEPKEGMLTRTLASSYLNTIAESAMGLENVVIHSFDADALGYIRELNSQVALCYIQPHLTTPTQTNFDICKSLGSTMMMCSESKVTPTVIDLATANKVNLAVYTPTPDRLNPLINLGVKMFVADYMAPPVTHKGKILQELYSDTAFTGFNPPSPAVNGIVTLSGNSMTVPALAITKLSAVWVEADVKGTCTISSVIGSTTIDTLSVTTTDYERVVLNTHSSNRTGNLITTFSGTCDIRDIKVLTKEF